MNNEINETMEKFIKTLIDKTVNHSLKWESLALRVYGAELISQNFYCEFHGAYFDKSYAAYCPQGQLMLMNEWSESGKDGTMAYNNALYIRANNHAEFHLLTTSTETPFLNRLFNALYYNDELLDSREIAEQFMLDFLNAQQDSE